MAGAKGVAGTAVSMLKLTIPAGGAAPSPPVGPALGQRGVKAIDFCRQFNDQSTRQFIAQTPLRCGILVRPDRTFTFNIRPPTTTWLLKRVSGVKMASSQREVARLPVQCVYEIARIKAQDPLLQHIPLRRIFEMIVASAKTCGFTLT